MWFTGSLLGSNSTNPNVPRSMAAKVKGRSASRNSHVPGLRARPANITSNAKGTSKYRASDRVSGVLSSGGGTKKRKTDVTISMAWIRGTRTLTMP